MNGPRLSFGSEGKAGHTSYHSHRLETRVELDIANRMSLRS
jgi:hypothetical protein